jgi:hypothetical protein
VTISIPNDLKRHLADPKIRKSFNVSRVCQEALRREVSRLLNLPTQLAQMEAVLLRLRNERDQVDDEWFAIGSAAARDWVEHEAPYAQLRLLGQTSLDNRLQMLRHTPPDSLTRLIERHGQTPGFSKEGFLAGWASTVGVMWEVIRENL